MRTERRTRHYEANIGFSQFCYRAKERRVQMCVCYLMCASYESEPALFEQ
jgi:hypothetical protein